MRPEGELGTNQHAPGAFLVLLATASFVLSSCASAPAASSTSTAASSTGMVLPSSTQAATATPVPLPTLTLQPGDPYFSLNGTQRFIFSRNLAGTNPSDYDKLLDLAQEGGTILVRVGTDNGAMGGANGYGYTATGGIRADWSNNWEHFFDSAEAKGIYVLPFFTGWMNWNSTSPNTWDKNPFNSANGGPANSPTEFFRKDSPTQELYLNWFRAVVGRWQKHKNIVAWEVITEVNNINGITEGDGVYLFEQLAKVAREADPQQRPISASLADIGEWPSFYSDKALDILDYHPYPYIATLDLGRKLLADVSRLRTKYDKPVIIGESDLNTLPPDGNQGSGTLPNAQIGIKHAIWSEVVSGTMNGRALYWEDSYGMYFSSLGWPYVEKYAAIELPAARFVDGVSFAGFKPLTAGLTAGITGAVLGDESMVIGWYRDATCEPPTWKMQPVVSKQTVTITVPGSASSWRVDFYDTTTGTRILSSASLSRQGSTVTVPLPDFQDDIAFKLYSQQP